MSDISDLFSRDPLSLTKSDRAAIIAEYRDKRERYMLGAKTAKAPKAAKTEAGSSPAKATTLSLEDLE